MLFVRVTFSCSPPEGHDAGLTEADVDELFALLGIGDFELNYCGWVRIPRHHRSEALVSDDSPASTKQQWLKPWF